MPFRFNPFTDKLDIVETAGSIGAVVTLTGNSGGAVDPDGSGNINVVGSSGTTVTGNPATHTLTITVAGSGMTWNTIAASQTLAVDNGYFCTGGAGLSLALPAVSNAGDTIAIVLDGSTSWTITQPNAGTQIRIANAQTTLGVGGTLASTQQGDTVWLVCETANARWVATDTTGNITVV